MKFKHINKNYFLIIIILIPILYYSTLYASDKEPTEEIVQNIHHLKDLLNAIDNTRDQILTIQQRMQSTAGVGRQEDLTLQISKLSKHLKNLEGNFHQLATDVQLEKFDNTKKQTFDWKEELKQLIEPLFREIKQMTSRPREIDKLETEIEQFEEQQTIAKKALEKLNAISPHITDNNLRVELNQIKTLWKNKSQEIKTRLNISRQKLRQKHLMKKNISEHLHELMQLFFRSRGRNLLLAIVVFALTWFLMYQLQERIHLTKPFQKHPRSVYIRTFDLSYWIATFITSLIALLLVLYFCGDWFLLSLFIIFVVGIAWASNHALPRYWKQARIILNLGPVREGEMIEYQGISYKVSRINLASELTNEKLDGGKIQLPLKDLLDMRSRPISEKECWFPSQVNDWVMLPDNNIGKILAQTPAFVNVQLLGDQIISYPTAEFLKISPCNLSKGFRMVAEINFDDQHQGRMPDIIQALTNSVKLEIANQPFHEGLLSVKTIFAGVGPFAFQLNVICHFNGNFCHFYEDIQNVIFSTCIKTCNENNWMISFYPVAHRQVIETLTPELIQKDKKS